MVRGMAPAISQWTPKAQVPCGHRQGVKFMVGLASSESFPTQFTSEHLSRSPMVDKCGGVKRPYPDIRLNWSTKELLERTFIHTTDTLSFPRGEETVIPPHIIYSPLRAFPRQWKKHQLFHPVETCTDVELDSQDRRQTWHLPDKLYIA